MTRTVGTALLLALTLPLLADQSTGTTELSLPLGATRVTLRTASPHAFILHVSRGAAATAEAPASSEVFLSPQPAGSLPAVTTVSEGPISGIKTSFGALEVNASTHTWRLLDAEGKVLANWASLDVPGSNDISPRLQIAVGPPAEKSPILFYGSGTVPDSGSLAQNKSGMMGNGKAALPQFWSTAGFGVLAVGTDADQPAGWKRDGSGAIIDVPGTTADVYLAPAPDLYAWLRADAELTGFAPVPPKWALGYLQSRWGWVDQKYIEDTLDHFRRDRLPVDAFILDFEWYTKHPDYGVPPQGDPQYVDFDWNPTVFPDPARQLADYLKRGLRIIGIRKPRLGNEAALADARAKGWILALNPNDPNGGDSRKRNLKFYLPDVRTYWETNNRKFLDAGMAAFWNDEGETRYSDYSYWNLAETDLWHEARPHDRFWSLNRSFEPGLQRTGAAFWTGDIKGDWATLARTPGELLAAGLAGMPYSTCDIGGFHGNAAPELLTRWMQAGVFFPVMRSHSENTATPHFPWLFGEQAEAAMRNALELRYRLLPYYNSLAHETNRTGAPLMRPLVMEFPEEPAVVNLRDEWLMGTSLLAAPVLAPGGARAVYLPKDTWYVFGTNQTTAGPAMVSVTMPLDAIPIYIRAGSLLPLGPVVQSTNERADGPLELQVYPGRDAVFVLTEDDGLTTSYTVGNVRETTFSWDDKGRRLNWHVGGSYVNADTFKMVNVVLYDHSGPRTKQAPLAEGGSVQF